MDKKLIEEIYPLILALKESIDNLCEEVRHLQHSNQLKTLRGE